jgi:hypothetical protein
LGAAHHAAGNRKKSEDAYKRAAAAIESLRHGGRHTEATLAQAFLHAASGRAAEANGCLAELLEHGDLPYSGWTLPIEPLLAPLRPTREFQDVLQTLAVKAR